MVERSLAFLMTLIFSDESRLSLFSTVVECGNGDSIIMVWVAIRSDDRLELVECQGSITSVNCFHIAGRPPSNTL